ncbi:MAG: UvrD-helicase domain-containing protein, partial [Calothrix sp. SM1_5_4]|nr:UvrD-helicase domain-containing protein [Calothrix sp. SM1_5_4]
MSNWLESLNPEQRDAVSHTHGPLLILAGAGSGKTTVLVSRTGRLIDEGHARPERICVLTFTNKAAHELKIRVARKLGKRAGKVWAGTFHGFGLQFLKEHYKEAELPKKFGIIDGNDGLAILKDLMREHKAYENERFAMERVMQFEREQGFVPRDISAENRGYDIESRDPKTDRLRFIEVKGRVKGAVTVTVTKNEILTSLNRPKATSSPSCSLKQERPHHRLVP